MDTTFTAPHTIAASQSIKQILYFAYGSNMWLEQMYSRCPHSELVGIGRLKGYKWIINQRGYANIIPLNSTKDKDPYNIEYTNIRECVYGMVYLIGPDDEARLDYHEGVPQAYTKESVFADFWPLGPPSPCPTLQPKRREMLIYIDRERVKQGPPREEYNARMNHAIYDLQEVGCPLGYVRDVLRHFIVYNPKLDRSRHQVEWKRSRGIPAREPVLDKENLPTTE